MDGINLNYAALIACILNIKLTSDKALNMMGVSEETISKAMLNDNHVIKKCEKERIERLYREEDLSMKQIGEIYNVDRTTIDRFMLRVGINKKPKGRRKGITLK